MAAETERTITRLAPRGWRRRLALVLATGFGLGWSPVASGTVGSLWGLVIVALMQGAPLAVAIGVSGGLALLAIPICHDAEAILGRKDDGRIVADEYLTFPICMLGLPFWPMIGIAFVTNRVFDIIKPPPARGIQRLPGGLGIVLDDVFAAGYSLAVNHAVYWLVVERWTGMG